MENILEFLNVTKMIDGKIIVKDLNFVVKRNDIVAYIGPNGAGKTTTIRLITDIYKPSSGTIIKYTNKIGVVLDKDGLYDNLTAYQQLNYVNVIYNGQKLGNFKLREVLKKVSLEDVEKKKIGKYSKGMKRRLAIATLLLFKPELVILDEPFDGLDPSGQKMMQNLIKEVSSYSSLFISSHNLSLIEGICNRVIILNSEILVDEMITSDIDLESIYFNAVEGWD